MTEPLDPLPDEMDGPVLVTVVALENLLDPEKIPDVDEGEAHVVSADADEPFRFIARYSDIEAGLIGLASEHDPHDG